MGSHHTPKEKDINLMKQGVGAVALVVKEKLFSVATKLKVLLVAGGWHQELGGWHQGGFWRVASGAPEGASGVATAACHPHIHHWPLLPCQHPSSFQAVSIDICTLNNFVISPAGSQILTKTAGTQFLLALLHPAPCTKVNLQPGLLETFVQETA